MTQPRRPAGTPTGGQFAGTIHDESDVALEKMPTAGDLADYLNNFDADDPVSLDDIEMFFDHIAESRSADAGPPVDIAASIDLIQTAEVAAGRGEAAMAVLRFAQHEQVDPAGYKAWREWQSQGAHTDEFAEQLDQVLDQMEEQAYSSGVALTEESFHRDAELIPESPEQADAWWADYCATCAASGPIRPDEWVFQRGEVLGLVHVPAPPVGTVIDEERARSLPAHTVVEANFAGPNGGIRRFRFMARDMPRWGRRDKHLSRRFTNLDLGTEAFVGGDDRQWPSINLGGIKVLEHP